MGAWRGGRADSLLRAVLQWIKKHQEQATTLKILIRDKEKWLPVVWSEICTDF